MMILERRIESYNTDEAYLKHQVIKDPTDEQIANTIKMSSIRELDLPKDTEPYRHPRYDFPVYCSYWNYYSESKECA